MLRSIVGMPGSLPAGTIAILLAITLVYANEAPAEGITLLDRWYGIYASAYADDNGEVQSDHGEAFQGNLGAGSITDGASADAQGVLGHAGGQASSTLESDLILETPAVVSAIGNVYSSCFSIDGLGGLAGGGGSFETGCSIELTEEHLYSFVFASGGTPDASTLFFIYNQSTGQHHEYADSSIEGGGILPPGEYYVYLYGMARCSCGYGAVDDSPGSVAAEFSITLTPKPVLEVEDVTGAPILNQTFDLFRSSADPPNLSESFIASVTTDSSGRAPIPEGLEIGDRYRIARRLHTNNASRHTDVLPTLFHVDLDNALIDSVGGYRLPELVGGPNTVAMGHTTVVFDLLVSIEWDADPFYISQTESALRKASNYLYDVYDGHLRLGAIHIYDDRGHWDEADIRVFASNMVHPNASVNGAFSVDESPVQMPRRWAGSVDASRNTGDPNVDHSADFRTRAHELGHYLIGLLDEYRFVPAAGPRCPEADNYGYMDEQYENPDQHPMRSEMSDWLPVYGPFPACQNTEHWAEHQASCWEVFEDDYEKIWGEALLWCPIVRPFDRFDLPEGVYHVAGPNDQLADLDADVGALAQFPVAHTPPQGESRIILVSSYVTGQPSPNVSVELIKPLDLAIIPQGNTADDGLILVFDTEDGDEINAWGIVSDGVLPGPRSERLWASGAITLGEAGADTLQLQTVDGDYPMVARVDLQENGIGVYLDFETAFTVPPALDVRTANGTTTGIPFAQDGSVYAATAPLAAPGAGSLVIRALDAGGRPFFAIMEFDTRALGEAGAHETLEGPNGWIEVSIDATGLSRTILGSSTYPALRDGLDEAQIQAGPVHSIAFDPEGSLPVGTVISLVYPESDLEGAGDLADLEFSLRVHRWDPIAREWVHAGGSVDAGLNVVSANVVAAGTYALFTTQTPAGIDSGDAGILRRAALLGCRPNPFGQSSEIEFELGRPGHVRLTIHDATGRLIALLSDGSRSAGRHRVTWNGTDSNGLQVASGLYFYRVQGPGLDAIGRMTIVR